MKKNVLVIGELNVDLILNQIQGQPEVGTEKLASQMKLTLGSSSAIFASNLRSQGTEVTFLGMIGEDRMGKLVLDKLHEKKVNTNRIIKTTQYQTGVTVVMNYDMDRAMVTYPGAMEYLSFDHFDKLALDAYDHVHISSIFLQPLIIRDLIKILEKVKKHNLTTSIDPQWDPSENWELDLQETLPLVDVFLPNEKEFFALTQSSSIDEGIQKCLPYCNILAIKKGEQGAQLASSDYNLTIEAFLNSDVADCIGAGDSFDAGFIHSYIHNAPLTKCLERGNIMGALNTTASGGTAAFKDMNTASILAKEKFDYTLVI